MWYYFPITSFSIYFSIYPSLFPNPSVYFSLFLSLHRYGGDSARANKILHIHVSGLTLCGGGGDVAEVAAWLG